MEGYMAKKTKYLLTGEAAKRFPDGGCSAQWVKRLVDSGQIEAERTEGGTRLIVQDSLERYLSEHTK